MPNKPSERAEAPKSSEESVSVPEAQDAVQKPNPSPKSNSKSNRKPETDRPTTPKPAESPNTLKTSETDVDNVKSPVKDRGDAQQTKTNLNNLIVKFLPPSMNSEGLYSLFSEHGELESCKVATNKNSGASLGYGFVRFKNDWAARSALIDLNGTYIQGKVLKVTYVDKAKKETPERGPEHSESVKSNIYVASLPHDWCEQDLKQYFGVFGAIQNCKVLVDSHGESRNVGFVQFENLLSSARAIAEVNGIILPGAVEAAIVKYARDASSSRLTGKDGESQQRPRKPKRQSYQHSIHHPQAHVAAHPNPYQMAHPHHIMSSYLPYGIPLQAHLAHHVHAPMPVSLPDGVPIDPSHLPISTSPAPDAHLHATHPHAHVSPIVPGSEMGYATSPEMSMSMPTGVHMSTAGNPSSRIPYYSYPMGSKPMYAPHTGRPVSSGSMYVSAPAPHPHGQQQQPMAHTVMSPHGGFDKKKQQEYTTYSYAPMYGHHASLPVYVDGHASYLPQDAEAYAASTSTHSHHAPSQHSQAHSTHAHSHPSPHAHTQAHIISGLAPEHTE